MLAIDLSAVATAVASAGAVGVATWLFLRAKQIWKEQTSSRVSFSLSVASLILGMVALMVAVSKPVENEKLPVGTIVALDDHAGCQRLGDAWQDAGFGKKVIAGVDQKDARFNYRIQGGEASVVLGAEHMPQIYLSYINSNHGGEYSRTHPTGIAFAKPASGTYFTGGNVSPKQIDLYPPYVALFLCRKMK